MWSIIFDVNNNNYWWCMLCDERFLSIRRKISPGVAHSTLPVTTAGGTTIASTQLCVTTEYYTNQSINYGRVELWLRNRYSSTSTSTVSAWNSIMGLWTLPCRLARSARWGCIQYCWLSVACSRWCAPHYSVQHFISHRPLYPRKLQDHGILGFIQPLAAA